MHKVYKGLVSDVSAESSSPGHGRRGAARNLRDGCQGVVVASLPKADLGLRCKDTVAMVWRTLSTLQLSDHSAVFS